MQFLYDENAGKSTLCVSNEAFHHLKVRRIRQNSHLNLRNLRDNFLYTYEIKNLNKASAELILRDKKPCKVPKIQPLSLAIALIEPKIIEKTLPFLNELGLKHLIFVRGEFSQGNFTLDFERIRRILINSCEQCGRADLMQISRFESSADFAKAYPKAIMLDFSGEICDFNTLKDELRKFDENGVNLAEKEREFSGENSNFIEDSVNLAKTDDEFIENSVNLADKECEICDNKTIFDGENSDINDEKTIFSDENGEFIENRTTFAEKEREFSGENSDFNDEKVIFIGAEGGFSDNERNLFKRKIRLKSPYILRSQSAIISLAARILL